MSKTKEWYMRENWAESKDYSTDYSKYNNIFTL